MGVALVVGSYFWETGFWDYGLLECKRGLLAGGHTRGYRSVPERSPPRPGDRGLRSEGQNDRQAASRAGEGRLRQGG